MFRMLTNKIIYPAYVSKHKSNHEKQIIFLMIPNGKGCSKKTIRIIKRNNAETPW